jgi:hypothetical protein
MNRSCKPRLRPVLERALGRSALLTAGLLLFVTGPALAQPPLTRLEILALDPNNQDRLGSVQPGGTYTLTVGETVRFRMSGTAQNGSQRFPATRFWISAGGGRVSSPAANVEVGNITIRAQNTVHRANPRERTEISFEIVDREIPVNDGLRRGSFYLDVRNLEQPAPDPGEGGGRLEGITLYEHQDFRGRSERFDRSEVSNLRGTRIGQDTASSVRIQPGCRAVLYEHPDFQGRSTVVTEDIVDLHGTRVGNDSVSSLTLDCSGATGGAGSRPRDAIALYEHQDFRGRSETFTDREVSNLRGTRIGQDTASSVRIGPGCTAVLYEHPNFEGRSTVVTEDIEDLRQTRVGSDTVSSFTLDCRRR